MTAHCPLYMMGIESNSYLNFLTIFGHFVPIGSYEVWAVWDGLNEEFFEIESKHYICDEDIAE